MTGYPSDALRNAVPHRLIAALLDFEAMPGRYPLTLREPRVLFDLSRQVLMLAAGRTVEGFALDPADAPRVQRAACFFVRMAMLRPGADHYTLLGLQPGFHDDALRDHYRLLMRLTHPDFAGASNAWPRDAATRINQANDVLASPTQRAEYNRQLAGTAPPRVLVNSLAAVLPLPSRKAGYAVWGRLRPGWRWGLAAGGLGALVLVLLQWPIGTDDIEPAQLAQKEQAARVQAAQADQADQQAQAAKAEQAVREKAAQLARAKAEQAEQIAKAQAAKAAREAQAAQAAKEKAEQVAAAKAAQAEQIAKAQAAKVAQEARLAQATKERAEQAAKARAAQAQQVAPAEQAAKAAQALRADQEAQAAQAKAAQAVQATRVVLAAVPVVPAAGEPVARPSLAEAQLAMGKMIQAMQGGRGDELLRGLDQSLRQSEGASDVVNAYNFLVGGSRAVRLGPVQLRGHNDADQLVVDGVVQLVLQDQGQPPPVRELRLRALFAQRGGQVVMTGLSAGGGRP